MVKELKDRIEMYQIKSLNEFNMSYKNHTLEEKIQFCIKNKARQEHILDQWRWISNQVEFLKQQNFDESSIDNEEINISNTVIDGRVNYDILLNTSRMNLANMKNDEYNTGYFANDNNHRNFINVPEIKRGKRTIYLYQLNILNILNYIKKILLFKHKLGTRYSDFDLNKAFEEMRHKEILNKASKEDISKSNTLKDIKSDPDEMYWELLDEEADSSSASEDVINENSKLNIKSLRYLKF